MANRDAKLIERTLKDFSLNVMSGGSSNTASKMWWENADYYSEWQNKQTSLTYKNNKEEIDKSLYGVSYSIKQKSISDIIDMIFDILGKRFDLTTKIFQMVDGNIQWKLPRFYIYQYQNYLSLDFSQRWTKILDTLFYLDVENGEITINASNSGYICGWRGSKEIDNLINTGILSENTTLNDLRELFKKNILIAEEDFHTFLLNDAKGIFLLEFNEEFEIKDSGSATRYKEISITELLKAYEIGFEVAVAPEPEE